MLAVDPAALVVRTSIYGWSPSGSRSLFEFFFNRLSSGQPAPGFTDVLFRPVSAMEMWPALLGWLSELQSSGMGGIRHATGTELISKYEFGLRVARAFDFDADLVTPASVEDSSLQARRPSVLDVIPTPVPGVTEATTWPPPMVDSIAALHHAKMEGFRLRLAEFEVSNEGGSP